MKKRKFVEGGGTSDDTLPADSGLAQALNQPGDNPEGMYKAIRQMTAAQSAKPKVVTKEELAKSGLSLRDYMNKQKGLTRRGVNPTLGEDNDANAQNSADAIDPGDIRTREIGRTRGGPQSFSKSIANTRTGTPRKRDMQDRPDNTPYASGGSVSSRADGIAQRGKTRGKIC